MRTRNRQPTPLRAVQKALETTFNISSHTVLEVCMSTRTCKVGIHGRNHEEWHELDFQVLRDANVEVVKAMSQTRLHHFDRIKRELPNVEIITRLHGAGRVARRPGQLAQGDTP
jgi:hypothetical protein